MTNDPTEKPSTPSSPKKGSELVNDIFASMAKGNQPMAPDQLDPNPTRGRTFILGRDETAKSESSPVAAKEPLFSRDIANTYTRQKALELQEQWPELTIEEIEDQLM